MDRIGENGEFHTRAKFGRWPTSLDSPRQAVPTCESVSYFIPGDMMRTTISLPDSLANLARSEARRRGVSFSAIVRLSLERHLCRPSGDKLPWRGIIADPSYAARDLDRAMTARWPDDVAGDR